MIFICNVLQNTGIRKHFPLQKSVVQLSFCLNFRDPKLRVKTKLAKELWKREQQSKQSKSQS